MAESKGIEDLCEAGQRKAKKTMKEFGNDNLTTQSGEKVTSRTRAFAIAMSQGRRACED